MPPAVGAQSLNHWTAREVPLKALASKDGRLKTCVFLPFKNPIKGFFKKDHKNNKNRRENNSNTVGC